MFARPWHLGQALRTAERRCRYVTALTRRRRIVAAAEAMWKHVDILLSPTLPDAPLPLALLDDRDRRGRLTQNTRLYNLTGFPALSWCLPNSALAIQLAAPRGRDGWLIRQTSRIVRWLGAA